MRPYRLGCVREPRIIIFDFETLPDLKALHRVIPQLSNYPGLTLKAQINSILCCAWKVFGQPEVHLIKSWGRPEWKVNINNDKPLLKDLIKIIAGADAVVTHNGRRFDWKVLQTRLLINKMKPMHDIPHIDTCTLARSNLTMFNNRLNNLGEVLVEDSKMENGGWDLWTRIQFHQNPKDLKLMGEYCKQDVVLTEGVFKPLMPFAKNIPNYNLWTVGAKKNLCPSCGSTRLRSNGYRATKTMCYKRLKCYDCGSSARTDAKGYAPRSI